MTGPKCSRNFVHWTYDTYAWARPRQGGGRAGRQDLVLHHRRLRLRQGPRGQLRRRGQGGGRQGSGRGPPSAQHARFLLVPAAGASLRRRRRRPSPMRAATLNNCVQAGARIRPRQTSSGSPASSSTSPTSPRSVSTRCRVRLICTAFYWDLNDGTRAFAKRFQAAHPKKMMPNDMHAGMYAATAHLIKAMAVTKSAADGVKLDRRR